MTTLASMPFDYSEIDIPVAESKGGAPAQPNPHEAIVKYLHDNHGDMDVLKRPARALSLPVIFTDEANDTGDGFKEDEKANAAEVSRHVRMLRKVGDNATPQYSVRTGKLRRAVKTVGAGKNAKQVPVNVITFWIHDIDGKPGRIRKTK